MRITEESRAFIKVVHYGHVMPLSLAVPDIGRRNRDAISSAQSPVDRNRLTRPSRHAAVMKTGQLLAIIATLGFMATACSPDRGNDNPSAISNAPPPPGQSLTQSDTQSASAGGTLAANPDGNRPAPTQGSQDGVYSGTAFPVNTGGGLCTTTERISDFRVEGGSVRWRSFRGRITNDRLRMVHGNTWITGQFTGDRFNGQIIKSHPSATRKCTFTMTLERAGA